jgi:predicted ribosomally synthesized peptide with SipW-like signal peptide
MKKIFGLTVAALLVMGLVGGGTWAYFSDPENSTGNTLTAGTLNLQVGAADPITESFTLTDKVPGDSDSIEWQVQNTGDVDVGYLDIAFTNIVDNENTVQEPETGDDATSGELAEALYLTIYLDKNDNDTYDSGTETLIFQDYVSGGTTELSAAALDDYSFDEGADEDFRIEWSIGTGVGNTIMSDIAGFDIEFSLDQNAD